MTSRATGKARRPPYPVTLSLSGTGSAGIRLQGTLLCGNVNKTTRLSCRGEEPAPLDLGPSGTEAFVYANAKGDKFPSHSGWDERKFWVIILLMSQLFIDQNQYRQSQASFLWF